MTTRNADVAGRHDDDCARHVDYENDCSCGAYEASSHYELLLEVHQAEEDEALAIARDLSRRFAANVTVTQVTPGRTFADGESRLIVQTVEPAS